MRLDDLAADRLARLRDVEVADQLLRDRRGALQRLAAGPEISAPGTDDRLHIDPALFEEALVLDRDRRVLQPRCDPVPGHRLANRPRMDHAPPGPAPGADRRHPPPPPGREMTEGP